MDNKSTRHRSLYIPYAGPVLLEFPLLNKGSAFSMEERSNFNLLGLLPEVVETIEEQAERAWIQYQGFKTEIDKHIYLRNIQDTKRNPLLPTGAKPSRRDDAGDLYPDGRCCLRTLL
ncbi:NAD-dependent malic enzyme [Leclercia adecarboxylata]|uniref:NAD-dependent malic enzyme n=1 Tax=Leclercia adecarboxylata TaxID=83655 RepID=A0A4U9HV52_9ENTR|nr:NAD-dependent malic enzyme [Leclercia adecarboxylata]